MTKPITGRPPKVPPVDAAERVLALATDGYSTIAIAQELGVGRKTLDKWRSEFPEIDEAYHFGVAREERLLRNKLREKALAGDTVSILFLLKCKHGWSEGAPSEHGLTVNITLPRPMSVAEFEKRAAPRTIEAQAKAIG